MKAAVRSFQLQKINYVVKYARQGILRNARTIEDRKNKKV